MAGVALAAAVNLPALTEQLLAADASSDGGDGAAGAAQAAKPALLSAAAAVAAAASALAGAAQEQAADTAAAAAQEGAVPSAGDVQALLEDEINALNRLLDGRWGVHARFCLLCLGLPTGCHQEGVRRAGCLHGAQPLLPPLPCRPAHQPCPTLAPALAPSCSALSEHLEPLYLANLQLAIEQLRQANGRGGGGSS